MKLNKLIYIALSAIVTVVAACNKNHDDSSTTVYTTSNASTLVTAFSLKANTAVMTNLDSVYFTVDPERRVIYNADSLPMGTNVTKLLTSVTFYSAIQSATYIAQYTSGGVTKTDTIKYTDSSTDSINFSGKVTLKVVSYDGNNTAEYDVKVNVHKVDPDTIVWSPTARRDLPGSGNNNLHQRTVESDGHYYCLLQTSQGFYISDAETPAGPWSTQAITWGFVPDVETFAATDSEFFILDTDGYLHKSSDLITWNATGDRWKNIIGTYQDRVLGLTTDTRPKHDEYPRRATFTPTPADTLFPVSGYSQLISIDPDWAVNPQALMAGGYLANGTLSDRTWGYDGDTWAIVSSNRSVLPPLTDVTLVPYLVTKTPYYGGKTTQSVVWLLFGGFTQTGAANRVTYQSSNMGITWTKAANGMQLPSFIPDFGRAQAFVHYITLPLQSAAPRRVSQPVTSWKCPYIYLFGGMTANGTLHNNVWTGVLNRLSFKPIY